MATEVVTNPEIPYVGTVEPGLEPGKMVRIRGKVPENAVRFAVNYQLGPILNPRDDIALHISPRFSDGVITRNHIESMTWGANEDEGPLCIRPGQEFEIIILCDHANYKIAINGRHFAEFAHRLPYEKVTHLVIDGDVEVSSITYEHVPIGSVHSSPPMSSIPSADFGPPPPGGLYPSLDTKSIPGYGPPPPGYGPSPSPYGPPTDNNQSGEKENSFGGLFSNIPWSGLAAAGSMVAMEYANRKREEEQLGKTEAPTTKSESGSALSSTLTAIATNLATSAIQRNLHAQQGYPSQGPGGDVLGSILGALGGAGAQRPAYQPPPPSSNTDPLSGALGSILGGVLGGGGGTQQPAYQPPPPPSNTDPLSGALGSILGGVLGGGGGTQQPAYQPSGGYGGSQPTSGGSSFLSGIGSALGSSLFNSAMDGLTKHGKDKSHEQPPSYVPSNTPMPSAYMNKPPASEGNKMTADEISKGLGLDD